METERVPGKYRQVISHPCRGPKLWTQQYWTQTITAAMDAPARFLHKAIPSHQPLRGRVQVSQPNTDKNLIMWPELYFDTLFLVCGTKDKGSVSLKNVLCKDYPNLGVSLQVYTGYSL